MSKQAGKRNEDDDDDDEEYKPEFTDIDLIEEGLYLGNITAATNVRTLSMRGVSHILTVESKPLPTNITSLPGMNFLYIKVDDMAEEDLLSHFEEAIKFMKDGQEKGNVLVHCYFGMSRSATLVTCFLMKKYKLSLDKALQKVKAKRRYVGPNSGFLMQLAIYEAMKWCLDDTNGQYRLYKLHVAARSVKKGDTLGNDSKCHAVMHPDPNNDAASGPVAYKCRSCRLSLIGIDSVVVHCPGETPLWSDSKWSDKNTAHPACDKGVFTFPIAWMGDDTRTVKGKLHCPKCKAKLGSFSWLEGHRCSCEAKITPAFYFIPSKLDKCS